MASDGEATVAAGGSSGINLAPGTHALSASYPGDNSFTASASGPVTFSVGLGTPFVVVGVNTNSMGLGQTVAVHVAVAGFGSSVPTGTVQITDSGSPVGASLALQTGGFFGAGAQTSTLLTNLAVGSHTFGASYNAGADPNYASVASGDPKNEISPLPVVTVEATTGAKTTTTLTATKAPVNLGDTGVFAVTVTPTTATGTVTLWDQVGPRSTAVAIVGGAASISIPWTQGGSTAVYAVYSGDTADAPSTSAAVPFSVNRGVPTVNLSAPATSGEAQQVSLNASVSGVPTNTALAYPTGTIEFWDAVNGAAAQIISVQSLTAGAGNVAVFALRSQFSGGTHVLHTHYRGDNNWQPADSPNVSLTTSDFSVAITPNPLQIAGGSAGTATITVTPLSGFTGTVNFTCATGGTAPPAGYSCSIAPSVTVGAGATTTPLNLNLSGAAAASAMKVAYNEAWQTSSPYWILSLAAGAVLLGLSSVGASGQSNARNFATFAGLMLCITSLVWGCGSGGRRSGGDHNNCCQFEPESWIWRAGAI
jgi:hypothetical protein